MKLKTILLFLFLFFIQAQAINKPAKSVLIINSYHKGFKWSDDVIKGIEKKFYNTNIKTTVLYMDSKRIASKEYYERLKDLYQLQLKQHSYDLVIAIDKFAYNFSVKNYKYLFTSQPIFFIGIEQFDKSFVEKYHLEDRVNGLLERRAVFENIKNVYKLMPSLKKLYIINDGSLNGNDTDLFIKQAIKTYKNQFKIEYIRKSTLLKLKEKFSIKKKDEAVFFIRFYNDENGLMYENSEIANMLSSIKLPVFVTDDLFIKNSNVMGGKLVPVEKLGVQSAAIVEDILDYPNNPPIIKTALNYTYKFNFQKIREFHLKPTILGEQFSYFNKPKTFFDNHRSLIDNVFVLSPLFIFLILGLLHNIYLKVKHAKQLKERMKFDKVLQNSIRSPIVWQKETGEIVEHNKKFIEFLTLPSPINKNETLKDYINSQKKDSIIDALNPLINQDNDKNELILYDKKGNELIFLLNHTNYYEDIYKTSGTVIVFMDVTKERIAQREKIKHQEFIIQQSKLAEIGEIFSAIAHQWKSPLVEIATIAQEQLYESSEEFDEQNSQYVNDIMIQVQYMTQTINNFQKFIMPSSKKTLFNIKESIDEMFNIVEHNIRFNYINIDIEVKENTNLVTLGYKNELMQTFLNIVNNAKDAILKAKRLNHIKEGHIKIHIQNIDGLIEISFEDNAGGIEPSHLNDIFKAYFTSKENGHGIGLYMAKLIIEDKIGGSIQVQNTNIGAKFTILLESIDENIGS